VIPPKQLYAALRAINRHLSKPESEVKNKIPRLITSCPDLVTAKPMLDLLYETPALTYAEQLIGKANRVVSCQIALRFPGDGCLKKTINTFAPNFLERLNQNSPLIGGVVNQFLGGDDEDSYYTLTPNWEDHWHIDGFPDAIKGLKTGEVRNFTMLLGVLLSEVPGDFCGNLSVYPGSHKILEKFFREKGGIIKFVEGTTFEGIQLVKDSVRDQMPPPVQLIGKPGDIYLCHYQLGHNIAANISPNVRYVVYFRLHHHSHQLDTPKPECMTQIWLDFDGIHDLTTNMN